MLVSLTFFIDSSYLTISFFTTSRSLLNSTITCAKLSTCNLSTLLFKLFKPSGKLFNSSISNLSGSDFRLAKSNFSTKSIYQHLLHFLSQIFFESNSTSILFLLWVCGSGK